MKFTALFAIAASAAAETILDVVKASHDHTTLLKLASGLPDVVAVLSGAGPLTLFAPTDAAFAKLDKATLDAVTTDSKLLQTVLTYHVIAGTAFDPATAPKKSFPATAQGQTVGVTVAEGVKLAFGLGTSTVTGSKKVDNGVVHIVDTVLVPPPSASATAQAAGLNELVKALTTAKLVEAVDGAKGATIFAPTDAAFKALFEFTAKNNITVTNDLLTQILTLHVVPKVVYSTDIVAANAPITAEALSKKSVTVKVVDGAVTVAGPGNATPAKVAIPDVLYNNGVVHVIDTVLLPDGITGSTGTTKTATAAPTATGIVSGASLKSLVLAPVVAAVAVLI